MSYSSDSENCMSPPELNETVPAVLENLPEKSRTRYNKVYKHFLQWKNRKNAHSFSETVLLSYLTEKAQTYKPSSLWSIYSMLKSTLMARNNINIKEYTELTAFLKMKSEGFRSKKSKALTTKDVYSFLEDAPDDIYLLMKVILILGVNGVCRSQELLNVTTDNIKIQEDVIIVKLPDTKTKIQRSFVITDLFYDIMKKYMDIRPKDMNTKRFLLHYKHKKCTRQVLGKNKICSVAKQIAIFLKLPNPQDYTGHCFRRTSAAILADSGANLTTIVAEDYLETSMNIDGTIIQEKKENPMETRSRNFDGTIIKKEKNSIETSRNFDVTIIKEEENSIETSRNFDVTIIKEEENSIETSMNIDGVIIKEEIEEENSIENKMHINDQKAESITFNQDSSPQPSTSAAPVLKCPLCHQNLPQAQSVEQSLQIVPNKHKSPC